MVSLKLTISFLHNHNHLLVGNASLLVDVFILANINTVSHRFAAQGRADISASSASSWYRRLIKSWQVSTQRSKVVIIIKNCVAHLHKNTVEQGGQAVVRSALFAWRDDRALMKDLSIIIYFFMCINFFVQPGWREGLRQGREGRRRWQAVGKTFLVSSILLFKSLSVRKK